MKTYPRINIAALVETACKAQYLAMREEWNREYDIAPWAFKD